MTVNFLDSDMLHDSIKDIDGLKIRERVQVYLTSEHVVAGGGTELRVLCKLMENGIIFPGGGVNKGEDIVAAAQRELEEESGLIGTNYSDTYRTSYKGKGNEWFQKHKLDGEITYGLRARYAGKGNKEIFNIEGDGEHFFIPTYYFCTRAFKKSYC